MSKPPVSRRKDIAVKLMIVAGGFLVLVISLYGYLSEYNVPGETISPSPSLSS